jgi:tyrosyl-tRNA synthetase
MSWSDELIIPGLEILTDMPGEEIESIKEEYAEGKSNPKEYKITLAKEIIRMIYKSEGMDVAEEKAQKAAEAFTNTFSKGGVPEDVTEIEPKTGLSHDYYSECALFNCYDPKKDSAAIDNLIVDLRDGVFEERRFVARHYEQKFPPTEFRDVVTNENKERVAKINSM